MNSFGFNPGRRPQRPRQSYKAPEMIYPEAPDMGGAPNPTAMPFTSSFQRAGNIPMAPVDPNLMAAGNDQMMNMGQALMQRQYMDYASRRERDRRLNEFDSFAGDVLAPLAGLLGGGSQAVNQIARYGANADYNTRNGRDLDELIKFGNYLNSVDPQSIANQKIRAEMAANAMRSAAYADSAYGQNWQRQASAEQALAALRQKGAIAEMQNEANLYGRDLQSFDRNQQFLEGLAQRQAESEARNQLDLEKFLRGDATSRRNTDVRTDAYRRNADLRAETAKRNTDIQSEMNLRKTQMQQNSKERGGSGKPQQQPIMLNNKSGEHKSLALDFLNQAKSALGPGASRADISAYARRLAQQAGYKF